MLCFQNMQYPPLYQLAQAVPDNILTSLCEMYSFSSSITASSVGSCSHCQVLSPILSRCWFLPQPLPSDGGAGESKPYPSFPIPTAKGSLAAFPTKSRGSFNGRGFLPALTQALNIHCPFWDVRLDLQADISVTFILLPWQAPSFAHLRLTKKTLLNSYYW